MSVCQRLCGGRCCESFPINMEPERIGEAYLEAQARILAWEARPYDWEVTTIAEMVVRIEEPDECEPRYSCKNLLPNGLCGAYASRPRMCSEYPGYGDAGRCTHCQFVPPIPPERRLTAGSSSYGEDSASHQ